jgi:type IV secretory pathway VirB10-like protein
MKTDDDKSTAVLERPKKAEPQSAHDEGWGEEAEKTGIRKWLMPCVVTVFSVFAVYSVGKKLMKADGSGAKKEAAAMMVQVVPPPPPVAPTPPPPPPKEEVREDKEVEDKQEDQAPPEPAVTTANSSKAGAGGISIAKGNNTGFSRKPAGSRITQAQRDFGVSVAKTIEDALRRHPVAKTAAGVAPKVRAAVSADGRITGLTLETSTGNPALDKIISEELTNLRTPSIAPEGTKFITVRISLRRPN